MPYDDNIWTTTTRSRYVQNSHFNDHLHPYCSPDTDDIGRPIMEIFTAYVIVQGASGVLMHFPKAIFKHTSSMCEFRYYIYFRTKLYYGGRYINLPNATQHLNITVLV